MRIISIIIILSFISALSAQNKNESSEPEKIKLKFGVLAKAYKDSIVVRFAPESSNVLPALIEDGVWIERLIVSGKYPYKTSSWEKITDKPIKPWQYESFNSKSNKENEYIMLVAQLLYGKLPTIQNKNDMKEVKDQASMVNSLFSLALLGCDFSAQAAYSMGLRYKDDIKIKQDEKVFYRVYSAFDHPLFIKDTTFTFSTYGEWEGYSGPKFLTSVGGERNIKLRWKHNKKLDKWSGFNIERSSDGGKSFSRLNNKPFLTMTSADDIEVEYTDSVNNYIPYTYRIEGLDPFGEKSDFSNLTSSYGIDQTPPGDLFLKEKNLTEKGIELSWNFISGKADSDLKHFIIKKGNDVNIILDTVSIVNKNTFFYHDKTPAKTKSKYYEVIAVDTAGNSRPSNPVRYFIPDTEPPIPPIGLKGTVNKNGIVELNWQLDTLDELVGYRVYRTNDVTHDLVCLQQGYLGTNTFFDTLELKTLTKEVYYAVCAIDLSYNHSKKSEVIKLIKPDVIPPFPPNFISYEVKEKSVSLQWSSSPSDDVKEYILHRKELNSKSNPIKINLSSSISIYNDGEIKSNSHYEYTLVAIDNSGLISDHSFPLTVKTYLQSDIEEIKLTWIDENNKTGFKWNELKSKPEFFIIYKNNGDGYTQYANVDGKLIKYEDLSNKQQKQSYGLQAIMKNGMKSPIYYIE